MKYILTLLIVSTLLLSGCNNIENKQKDFCEQKKGTYIYTSVLELNKCVFIDEITGIGKSYYISDTDKNNPYLIEDKKVYINEI